jgi:hypothetical protein
MLMPVSAIQTGSPGTQELRAMVFMPYAQGSPADNANCCDGRQKRAVVV